MLDSFIHDALIIKLEVLKVLLEHAFRFMENI